MKELILSNVEREFILKAISERRRVDEREAYSFRPINITFGLDRGCCIVDFANTKVMAQVSCEVTAPKDSRPNEGILVVNVELSPMAAAHFEAGRPSEESIEINRLLERCLRDSHCLDTESLCIASGLKVWTIRVDVHVINYDGNVTDAASVAAMAALIHFRRPDVSVCGDEITVHSLEDRDPIPLSILHMPICVTFAFFHSGKFMVIDPTQREQMVADGLMVVAMNKHREICLLQMSGSMMLLPEQVTRCSNIAAVKVANITELIQTALQSDVKARLSGKTGFAASVDDKKLTNVVGKVTPAVDLRCAQESAMLVAEADSDSESADSTSSEPSFQHPTTKAAVTVLDTGVAAIGEGLINSWEQVGSEMDEELQIIKVHQSEVTETSDRTKAASVVELSDSGSEEESVLVLGSGDTDAITQRSPPSNNTIDLTVALKKKKKTKKSRQKTKSQIS